MRVQTIANTSYQARHTQKYPVRRNVGVVNPSFNGVKGGTKGALAGAGAAALLSIFTPFGLAILPLWAVGGAIAGSANEDENKDSKDNKEHK